MAKGEESADKKKKNIVTAADMIKKRFGRSIEPVGKKILEIPESISTGSILLDQAIGDCKGWPVGSCIEIFGWEGAGKTLLMYLAFAEAQKKWPNRPCVLIDAERQFRFQSRWAQKVGVDVSKLIVLECSTAEECFDMATLLVLGEHEVDEKTGATTRVITPGNYAIIGVDSVTQLTAGSDATKDLDAGRRIGGQAAAIGLGLKKVTSAMSRADVDCQTVLMFINQLRSNPSAGYGANPEYRTGGNALPFYDTLAVKVAKVWKSEERDENGAILSHQVKVKFEKNKAGGMPEEPIVFTLRHDGSGVDNEGELFDVALSNGLIYSTEVEKKGKVKTVYSFAESTGLSAKYVEFGKIKFNNILEENPEIEAIIKGLIKDNKIFASGDIKEEIPESSYIDPSEVDQGVAPKKKKNRDEETALG